jgi:4-amino-4-deoxy-L-arabinose transferase-like glycosyltransferase
VSESPNPPAENNLPTWVWTVLGLIAVPAFLLGLTVPFIGPDEPRYAEVGREMWQTGDWITPTLGGFHWFEKPPLLYWLEACFYSIFGVNEFAARLGPALCGLGIVVCLWLVVRMTSGREERGLANWIAVIAASTLGLITFSHAATTDVVVTLPLTIAMSAFFVYDRRSTTGDVGAKIYTPLATMYIAAGLAVLAKGLIGLVFPPAIILVYHAFSRRWPSRTLILSALWGLPVTLAVAAIWYVPMYLRYGDEFITEFIIRQHFERFTTNVFQHPQPFYFYLWVLPLMTMPWLPFFVAGLWKAVRQIAEPKDSSSASCPLLLFSFAWLLVPLLFFSASGSKLPGYVLPSLPAAIIMTGIAVNSLGRSTRVWTRISAVLAGVTLVAVSVVLVVVLPGQASQESVKPLLDAAAARGFASSKIVLMHADSFSSEFYAGNRLPRTADGKQFKLYGASELEQNLREGDGSSTLVLIPKEYSREISDDPRVTSEVLAENRDSLIAIVTLKN